MKLKPEVKGAWLEALRGGEYKQGTGVLRNYEVDGGKSYCCLGVLCDAMAKQGLIKGEWDLQENFVMELDGKKIISCSYPAHHIVPIVFENVTEPKFDSGGIAYVDPEVRIGKQKKKLSELNDEGIPDRRYKGGVRQFGFKEIADIIEKQL